MRKYVFLLIGFAILGLVACKKEKEFEEVRQRNIISVTGPTTGSVNSPVTLTVTYPYSNGCDYIGHFEESRNGNVISIKAFSKPVPKNAVCTQDAGTRTIEYRFTSATAGTFELRFLRLDGTSVNHTITIQ